MNFEEMSVDRITWTEFEDAVDCGRKIEAIKMLRAMSGMGLKESKDAVELFASSKDFTPIRHFFGGHGGVGCQLGFENATVTVMPTTREVKIDGFFRPEEWQHLVKILAVIDPIWRA